MNRTRKTLRRTFGKKQTRHTQKGGWGIFRWFTKKSAQKSKPRRSWFSSKKKDMIVISSNLVRVDMPGHEQHGKTGAEIEEEKREKNREEKFQKEKNQSNDELRGIFDIKKRNHHNQPMKSMKSPMKSSMKSSMKSPMKSPMKSK